MNELHPTVRRMEISACALCAGRTRVFCEICNVYVCEKMECKAAHAAVASANEVIKARESN